MIFLKNVTKFLMQNFKIQKKMNLNFFFKQIFNFFEIFLQFFCYEFFFRKITWGIFYVNKKEAPYPL
jgi:hypothetical protein